MHKKKTAFLLDGYLEGINKTLIINSLHSMHHHSEVTSICFRNKRSTTALMLYFGQSDLFIYFLMLDIIGIAKGNGALQTKLKRHSFGHTSKAA
ncbi:hypothetical protein [Halopseudomonas salegens]|uniref:Uncharacterized protein n=1 Tax=Halopseudomonas salegens TaxID=1434072 RepID=A0A1H2HYR8_9GAMM|nr:hypothetical protein [Halopseudomonas salegens]SDU36835.1 hypothetical protein SAMN05216210_3407 [Halopseudomonas salegens]